MLVAFRVDASNQIGTGHVMRCLTLADYLKNLGHKCFFVCREHVGHLGDLISSRGHGIELLKASSDISILNIDSGINIYSQWLGVTWQDDARQTLDTIYAQDFDWLIVDHYALDSKWEDMLASSVTNIMVIDDLANRRHNCDLLLDQNLGRKKCDYKALLPQNCTTLIGPYYGLLRPEFLMLRDKSLKRRKNPDLGRVLISLGGVDCTNVTSDILSVLNNNCINPNIQLDIVMGANAPHLDQVIEQAADLSINTTVDVNVTDMAERMSLADFSIGAAGSTSWERCCMGLPSITVVLAENQRLIAEALAKHEASFLVNTGQLENNLPCLIEQYMGTEKYRIIHSRNAAKICDGKGCERVVSALIGERF